jgi:hypothetical protein
MRRIAFILLASAAFAACGPREDPARAGLRARLEQQEPLSAEEIARVFGEVSRTLAGRTVGIVRGSTKSELGASDREIVLGMLTDRTGVFDEGLRSGGGRKARVFNAPGQSNNPEIEASRRLFVDVESFQPFRFEFAHAFASPDDYALDLTVE